MKLRSLAVATILFLIPVGGLTPAGISSACAASARRAALVVDTGDQELRFCVVLPPGSVDGVDLIELASDQHGLQYRLGYGGQGVCQLAGVGSEGEECFTDSPEFWGYWQGDGSGGWSWSGTGAGSVPVSPGDVQGWSYGTGRDGNSHQAPPATTYGSVCPTQETGGDEGGGDENGGGDGAEEDAAPASPTPSETTAPADEPGGKDEATGPKKEPDRKKDGDKRKDFAPNSVPLSSGPVSEAAAGPERSESGVPTSGIVAVMLALGLGAGGAVVTRRRRAREGG